MAGHAEESSSIRRAGRHRKSENFAVRRWLRLGAASAGMGAALLGFSLLRPDVGTATADTGSESSASAGPSESGDAAPARSSGQSDAAGADEASEPEDSESEDAEAADAADDAEAAKDAEDAEEPGDADDADAAVAAEDAEDAVGDLTGVEVEPEVATAELEYTEPEPVTRETHSAAAVPDTTERAAASATQPPPYVSEQSEYQKRVAAVLQGWTDKHQAWVDSLQISDAGKERLQASFLAMRRTFFNQAPTVAPVQIAGVIAGPVIGSLGGVDPDGDRLIYLMTRAPKTGTVTIDADGTYTYTPGDDFTGVDTFYIAAIDLGLHINLLQPLRPLASGRATSLVNQGAVVFDFAYTSGRDYWNDESRGALQRAANLLIENFRVVAPVVLTYDVAGFSDASSATLANAFGLLTNDQNGFWRTRIQHEIITGEDLNGPQADGYINVNFAKPFAYGDTVAGNR